MTIGMGAQIQYSRADNGIDENVDDAADEVNEGMMPHGSG